MLHVFFLSFCSIDEHRLRNLGSVQSFRFLELYSTEMMAHSSVKPPIYIDAARIKVVLKLEEVIPIVEKALANFSARDAGGIVQPLRTTVQVNQRGVLLAMPGYSAKDNCLAVKLLTRFPENEKQGLPSHNATIMTLNPSTGLPQAIMDGDFITGVRTAAASAVATKYLASKDVRVLCILGSGAQARSHAQALQLVRSFNEIRVWSRTQASAQKFADEIGAKACSTVEEAVTGADVIVTVTLATSPVVFGKWVKPGALVNAVGAARPDRRELDDELMQNSFVVADSIEAAQVESGDVILSRATVSGEIGDVISGKLEVPKGKTVVFKSLGMAVEDVVTAKLVLDKLQGDGEQLSPL